MAMIKNRGNGKWLVTISGGYGPDGKQIRVNRTIKVNPESTETSQRRQVEREAAALETDFRRHLITEAKKIQLSKVAEEFLESKPMAESTRAGYRALLDRRIIPKLGKVYVQDLTPRMIRDFYKYLEKDPARPAHNGKKGKDDKPAKTRSKTGKLSGTSRKHYHQVLSAILNFAVKSGYITVNPMAAVNPPRQDTPETEVLEAEDIAKLLDTLEDLPDILWRAFFTLDLYTSCRPGELIGMNWSDLEITPIEGTKEKRYTLTIRAGSNFVKGKGTVRTDRPKTKSSRRTILLPPEAYQPLMKWKSAQAEQRLQCGECWEEPDAMFTSTTGRRLSISKPTHEWREIQKQYDLKDVHLYALRHTGASLLIAAGCDVKEVSGRLGHSRASTTLDTYTHLFEKVQQHTTDVISSAIAEARKASNQ